MVTTADQNKANHEIHEKEDGKLPPPQSDKLWECLTHAVLPNPLTEERHVGIRISSAFPCPTFMSLSKRKAS